MIIDNTCTVTQNITRTIQHIRPNHYSNTNTWLIKYLITCKEPENINFTDGIEKELKNLYDLRGAEQNLSEETDISIHK